MAPRTIAGPGRAKTEPGEAHAPLRPRLPPAWPQPWPAAAQVHSHWSGEVTGGQTLPQEVWSCGPKGGTAHLPEAVPLRRYLQGSSSIQSVGIKQGCPSEPGPVWGLSSAPRELHDWANPFPSLNFIFLLCDMS